MDKQVYILGAGGMAAEAMVIYDDLGEENAVKGFIVDDLSSVKRKINKKPIYEANIIERVDKNTLFLCAIASPNKNKWTEKIEKSGFKFDTLIHPSVVRNTSISIRQGAIIAAGVVLTCNITIGRHTIVNVQANIHHDCFIGNCTFIGPGANIGGNVRIGDQSWIGIGATIIQNTTIGSRSFIGAGAVVVNDIPDNTLALGVPAKPIRKLKDADWGSLT